MCIYYDLCFLRKNCPRDFQYASISNVQYQRTFLSFISLLRFCIFVNQSVRCSGVLNMNFSRSMFHQRDPSNLASRESKVEWQLKLDASYFKDIFRVCRWPFSSTRFPWSSGCWTSNCIFGTVTGTSSHAEPFDERFLYDRLEAIESFVLLDFVYRMDLPFLSAERGINIGRWGFYSDRRSRRAVHDFTGRDSNWKSTWNWRQRFLAQLWATRYVLEFIRTYIFRSTVEFHLSRPVWYKYNSHFRVSCVCFWRVRRRGKDEVIFDGKSEVFIKIFYILKSLRDS